MPRFIPGIEAVLLMLVCLLFWPLNECAFCGDIILGDSVELPKGPGPVYTVGHRWFRQFAVTTDITSKTGAPVIVVAKRNKVWYLDSETLQVLARREYPENDLVVISRNGAYLSAFSRLRNRRTGKVLLKMRIEDWAGAELWGMKFHWQAPCEPTPTGGFIAYPTRHLKDEWLFDGLDADYEDPPALPHGLQIYDRQGNLLLEGIGYEECRLGYCWGSVSPEGRYLGTLFVSVPQKYWDTRERGADRACLVLYDIERGIELWRHYFEGIRPGGIIVGPDADRIACFVSAAVDEVLGMASDYRLYVFDHTGTELLEQSVPGCEGVAPPRDLKMSPDGGFFGFETQDTRMYVKRLQDGSEFSSCHWRERGLGLRTFGLDSGGRVLALVSGGSGEERIEPRLVYVDADGVVAGQLEVPFASESRVHIGAVGDSGRFWMVCKDQLYLLAHRDDGSTDDGD